jgi:predicted RNA methylase
MTDLDFLQRINWSDHDGVNLPMINDFLRNQFYDTIIKNNVAGRDCIDIGFGNGLLSMMALEHGANSIVAFESNKDRFQLAELIVGKLGLQDKIQLVNEIFDYSKLDQYPQVSAIFHETLDTNAWHDGLFKKLPRNSKIRFLPNEYKLDIIASPISKQFAKGLLNPMPTNLGFNPGIDVSLDFIRLINEIGFPKYQMLPEVELPSGLIEFDYERETLYGWQLGLKFARSIQQSTASYSINSQLQSNCIFDKHGTRTVPIDFDMPCQKLIVDTSIWKDKIVLIVPRFDMIDDNEKMTLDTGHWGFVVAPILLVNPTTDLEIIHDLHSGEISYNLI